MTKNFSGEAKLPVVLASTAEPIETDFSTKAQTLNVPVQAIRVLGSKGSKKYDAEYLKRLRDSLEAVGQAQPLPAAAVVQLDGGEQYFEVQPSHLFAALEDAELTHVDVIIDVGAEPNDRLREIVRRLWVGNETVLDTAELVRECVTIFADEAGQFGHPGGVQPHERGISKTAAALGMSRQMVRRLKSIGDLTPAAKDAAKATAVDDNQGILLEAAKKPTGEDEVAEVERAARRRKERRHAKFWRTDFGPREQPQPDKSRDKLSDSERAVLFDALNAWRRSNCPQILRGASPALIKQFIIEAFAKDDTDPGSEAAP